MSQRKRSALFRHIEALQGDHPWGAFLDAGTGVKSLDWVSGLDTEQWTAVTGSTGEAKWVDSELATAKRPQDMIITGNWSDPSLLEGQTFDTVLADYLLGAIEGFAPYYQPYLFSRLRALTGSRLYVTGLEPYVPTPRPETEAGRILWEIGRHRDACVLLSGDRPYREYPALWAADHMQKSGFSIQSIKHFSTTYKQSFVNAQIDLSVSVIAKIDDADLASALTARSEALRAQALDHIEKQGGLKHCRNYVIAAEIS